MDNVTILRSATTVVALLMFIAIVFYAYRRGSKDYYDKAAMLPLVEDDQPDSSERHSPPVARPSSF